MTIEWKRVLISALLVTTSIFFATLIGFIFDLFRFPDTNIVIIYILSVLIVVRIVPSYFLGIVSAIVATTAFNYFFTAPFFSFYVYDPNYYITFIIMAITVGITSAITSKERKNTINSSEKEKEIRILYELTGNLTEVSDSKNMVKIIVSTISSIFHCNCSCLCVDEEGNLEAALCVQGGKEKKIDINEEQARNIKLYIKKHNYSVIKGEEFYDWPICRKQTFLGFIRIPSERASRLNESQKNLLYAMIESIALAMDRLRQVKERMKFQDKMIQEKNRSDILRSISHDLRTPLSGIMGTTEMLMDLTDEEDERYILEKNVYADAEWLLSLVENVLNLSKLRSEKLILNKECEVVEEIIGGALNHIRKRVLDYDIIIEMPEELIEVPMEAKLIEQVLINLIDNAVKHTKDNKVIKITATVKDKAIEIAVIDNGEGISDEDSEKLFELFYTSNSHSKDVTLGIGLGLCICEAIVKAHNGTISAENKIDGSGAIFRFTLPMKEEEA